MDSKALLSLNKLSVWYTADHPVLSNFSLDLGANEVVGLIGLNAPGKPPLSKPWPVCCQATIWTAQHGTVIRFRSGPKISSGADILSLQKIGHFSISHSGNIWRMWLCPMVSRCRMCLTL